MFEYKIQQAWDSFKKDFGLGRILLLIMSYNTLLTIYSLLDFGKIRLLVILPVAISFVTFYFRPWILKLSSIPKFLFVAVFAKTIIILNYYLIGELDAMANGLTRIDSYMASFDHYLFGTNVASLFENFLRPTGLVGQTIYDIMMLSYMCYYLLPVYGGYVIFKELSPEKKFKICRYSGSFIIFFLTNFLCYLLFPVTGPQFYLKESFQTTLPLSSFGHFLWLMVRNGQTTFIDCFPSGHTGIAILTSLWFFKVNHSQRFLILFISICIIGATLAMRYHYTLDVICAIPLVLISFKLSWVLFPVTLDPHLSRRNH